MTPNLKQIIERINDGITPSTTYTEFLTFLIRHFPLYDSNIPENRYRFGSDEILITLIKYSTYFVVSVTEQTKLRVISKTEEGFPIYIEIGSN